MDFDNPIFAALLRRLEKLEEEVQLLRSSQQYSPNLQLVGDYNQYVSKQSGKLTYVRE